MLPWVVLLLLGNYHVGRPFSGRVDCLLVYPHAPAPERVVLFLAVIGKVGLLAEPGGLDVVQGRSKVDVHIGLNDADGIILIFGLDLEDVDVELLAENLDGDGVLLVKTGEVSELVLQDCLGVVQVDEFGLMRLQLDHVPDVPESLLEVRDQSHGGGTPGLREFQHFEHPCRNIAQSFLGHELQHPAVSHLRTIFQAEDQGIFVFGVQKGVKLVEG